MKSRKSNWLVLSDEQMSKTWQFSLLKDEQMSNKVGVKHQPAKDIDTDYAHLPVRTFLLFEALGRPEWVKACDWYMTLGVSAGLDGWEVHWEVGSF